jgi:hypothetical protein
MQGPVFNSELRENGGSTFRTSKHEALNVNLEEPEVQSQANLDRIALVGSLYKVGFDTNEKILSTTVGPFQYTLKISSTGNKEVPLKLDIEKKGEYNAMYSVYLSEDGEYLQKDLISSIINRTQFSIEGQDIEISTKPELYSELDFGASEIDDILLKFW